VTDTIEYTPQYHPKFNAKEFLHQVSEMPGVYRMFNEAGEIIYVGKAKNLKKRLQSYFRKNVDSAKTQALVALIHFIETTVTSTELEALLLEQNLIKKYHPKYNILMRDDKSYPYIIMTHDLYPRVAVHRGTKKANATYFGPYPSGTAVRESLSLLQKLFKVRQCENSYFANRSRPCLQYQIKRCKAPCVQYVTPKEYGVDVDLTQKVLQGKNQQVLEHLVSSMELSSQHLQFESAAIYRDQIRHLRYISSEQSIEGGGQNLDVVAVACEQNVAVIHRLFYRNGRVVGSRSYYPKIKLDCPGDVLEAYISQSYFDMSEIPQEILVAEKFSNKELLQQSLSLTAQKKIKITLPTFGQRLRLLELAQKNANQELSVKLASNGQQLLRLKRLAEVLELQNLPKRMECFDISHTGGEFTVASCVVFGQSGPEKTAYRRYNIKDITPGDDYAAMHQALTRRFKKLQDTDKPNILFIDGGKGQLKQAQQVLDALEVTGILLVGVAKGAERKAGAERLFIPDKLYPVLLKDTDPALHLIQHIRDESHRFAITGHRNRRGKNSSRTMLEDIPGIGPKKRAQLLKQFGGLQTLQQASVKDISMVPGISASLAMSIYQYLSSGSSTS